MLLSKEPAAVDAWNSPERLTLRPGIQLRSNRRRFSGYAALDDSDNYCRQYDEVKERSHWYQEKPNCVHISTSSFNLRASRLFCQKLLMQLQK
jgi:hypothetical protein